MNRSLPYQRWVPLTLTVATLALACHPAVDAPGVPLYPNGKTTRLLRSQIAQVAGPIAKIDGQDVVGQGGWFELLPGCHVVELDRRPADPSGAYWSGRLFASTTYAIRMKAGARYFVRREVHAEVHTGGSVDLSAREEEASGALTYLDPAKSEEELEACRE